MKHTILFLLALAGLAGAQNLTVSSNVDSILRAANYAAIRGLLDLEPTTDFLSPSAIAAGYQPLDSDLTAWAAVSPSSYLTTTAAAAAYQPLAANLTSWAAVAPASYLSTTAAASGYQPLDADLTTIAGLADPNADRILFWDDSAGAYAYLTAGSGLLITGTTLTATGGSFDEAADYTLTGTWDYTGATLTLGDLSVTTLDAATLEIANVAVTSSAAEINVLDGVAAGLTAAELSVLDGITSTVTELNYTDGVTSAIQTQIDTKAPNTGTQTGVHATPSTSNPLAPTWTGPMHTVWYGATGEIDLPAAAGYSGRGLMVYNTGAFTVTIDPNGSEVIVRDGNVQTGGVTFTLSSGAGNFVALLSDGARWVTLGYKGTLSVGS